MLENRFRWLAVALAALSLTAAGCTEDDASSDGGPDRDEDGGDRPRADAGDNPTLDVGIEEDAGGGGGDDTGGTTIDPDEVCGNIPDGENLGTECSEATGADFCGDGGLCVTPPEAASSICAQLCFPELCDDTCGGGQACIGVADENGDALQVDVDGDGTPETDVGACADVPTGDTESFGVCDGENLCQSGDACLVTSEAATTGICFPECDGATCGAGEACVLATEQGGDPTHCLPTCTDTAESSDCQAGWVCVSAGAGGNVCAPEDFVSAQ